MKQKYIDRNFTINSRAIIMQANSIIKEYQEENLQLTLRQLYYQFVSRDIIANKQTEYKRLGSIINDARLAGVLDWDILEDRGRNLNNFYYGELLTPQEILDSAADGHEIDYWKNQEFYIEVWVEKEALVGILERVCNQYRVPYFACKGYTSQSEQWRAGKRFVEKINEGKECVVLHLGDHDPSGIDMTRDNLDRLTMFIEAESNAYKFGVKRLALNMNQIEQYKPPHNPVKLNDSRVGGYRKLYGEKSWELDALNPKVISKLIKDNILSHIDASAWKKSQKLEAAEKKTLTDAADKFRSDNE